MNQSREPESLSPLPVPMPAVSPYDLGVVMGFTPRILFGCLGWHLAVQPGPDLHVATDRLPPMLRETSALCPVLVLPPSAAEVGRGSAVRNAPAIRQPVLRAWEQAVTLIVQRNRQAIRFRKNDPALPGKSPRPVPVLAAVRPAQPRAVLANGARDKDPLRRESAAPPGDEVFPATVFRGDITGSTAGDAAVKHRQDPIRREPAATVQFGLAAPAPSPAEGGISTGADGRAAMSRENPLPRETSATSDSERRPPRTGPLRNGNPRGDPNLAPRCGARTRQGCPCRGPAMRNGRCRMHGGKSTGPRTAEGLARLRAARTRHGAYSAEVRAFDRSCRALMRDTKALLAFAESSVGKRQVIDPETLLSEPPGRPQLLRGRQTSNKSPYAVSMALPKPPLNPGDRITADLKFGPVAAHSPSHLPRQDPIRRERQPPPHLPAACSALPDPAVIAAHRPARWQRASAVTDLDRPQEARAP